MGSPIKNVDVRKLFIPTGSPTFFNGFSQWGCPSNKGRFLLKMVSPNGFARRKQNNMYLKSVSPNGVARPEQNVSRVVCFKLVSPNGFVCRVFVYIYILYKRFIHDTLITITYIYIYIEIIYLVCVFSL